MNSDRPLRARLYVRFLLLGFTLMSLATSALATKYPSKPGEAIQLPQFCWGQYLDGFDGGPYTIPWIECGPFMNHYCPALLELKHAMAPLTKKGTRLNGLNATKREVQYTLNGMKEYPACPIREHVLGTQRQVDQLLKIYSAPH